MKTLDKYIAKNFLIGYFISLMVLVGMRIVIDLFVNLDEFAEQHTDLGTIAVLWNICRFYGIRSCLYFRDSAGMITVVAAVFSLGKMIHNNELIAVMASGVSLKRVIAPIVLLAILFTGFLIIDQEFVIPRFANELTGSHDELPGQQQFSVWYMPDSDGSLICASKFEEASGILTGITIVVRQPAEDPGQWTVKGVIQADSAEYDSQQHGWNLLNGRLVSIVADTEVTSSALAPQEVDFYKSNITPQQIPMRQQEGYKTLLSSAQLAAMAKPGTKVKDLAELHSQKHFRITDPIINMVMLLVALPILICRDPKAMKSAIMISFAATAGCFIVTFFCKMTATEVFFSQVRPELWAWLPVFIFLPIAVMELDSMKT
jgi:lipopolysaccharide export system permease protein